jgi:hypothetical protein
VGYRYSAKGTLEVAPRNVGTVCSILTRKGIQYTVDEENRIQIDHNERAATPAPIGLGEPFEEIARYVDEPQSLFINSEILGEANVGFVGGKVRIDTTEKVWSKEGEVPTPDRLVALLKARGIAARVTRVQGSRKNGRRTRVFDIEPGSGGPACRVTIKRRFWDSYDLLSVPDVYKPLCRKYHTTPAKLRDALHSAKFGVEVRNPALGGPSSDMLFDNLLEIIEEQTEGIRTALG